MRDQVGKTVGGNLAGRTRGGRGKKVRGGVHPASFVFGCFSREIGGLSQLPFSHQTRDFFGCFLFTLASGFLGGGE